MLILYVCIPKAPYVLKMVLPSANAVWSALASVPTHTPEKKDYRIFSWVVEVRDSAGIIQPEFNRPS